MEIHLVDGTYELFRHFYSPGGSHLDADGREVGAVRGVLRSVVSMLEDGATHIGVATDHVITSFRNDLYPGYKTGEGIDPDLWSQFGLLEDALEQLGFTVWPMVEVEADDALAAAALVARADNRVERVFICTPDKDLAQCVIDPVVVQFDRRAGEIRDSAAVFAKYGVWPESIPDYLALVGDAADGFPGLPGWGAKSAATVLAEYRHLERIPSDPTDWSVNVRSAAKLSLALRERFADALLFRRIATLETDVEVGWVDQWRWTGPTSDAAPLIDRLGARDLSRRLAACAATR